MITKRSISAIRQEAFKVGAMSRVDEVLHTLSQILPILGEQSRSRHMVNRIGSILLQDRITIVAPSCPDYSHTMGRYTFASVGTDVPLLAKVHIELLDLLSTHIPHAHYEIVMADQEANDTRLCARVGLTREEFRTRIEGSVCSTRASVSDRGWSVGLMTERFPTLLVDEKSFETSITNDPTLEARIIADTSQRSEMYMRLGVYDHHEMRKRTIRTAAQYSALACLCARERILVCNHQTVNLTWYNAHGAAVLHNPVSVY